MEGLFNHFTRSCLKFWYILHKIYFSDLFSRFKIKSLQKQIWADGAIAFISIFVIPREDIFTCKNIYEAHKKCRKSKQHKGEVIRFEVNLSELNLFKSKSGRTAPLRLYLYLLYLEPSLFTPRTSPSLGLYFYDCWKF